MTAAFDPQALMAKSKVFIERGLLARDAQDAGLFHMWAALALELLGKSALAHIHPVLVADPSRFPYLLAACGRLDTDDVKSIAAKTVYERIQHLSKQYDKRAADFCMLMANRRNEELHSGACTTQDLKLDSWLPEFWRIAQIMLQIRGETLRHWIGDVEAASADVLISDSSKTLEEAVLARIRRCRSEFERRYPNGSVERARASEFAERSFWPSSLAPLQSEFDSHEKIECPACKCEGWLFGFQMESHHEEPQYDEDSGWVQYVGSTYSSEAFACPVCDLRLTGRTELDAASLPDEFETIEVAEPDYGDEYGNC
jgi:hypothetical protein